MANVTVRRATEDDCQIVVSFVNALLEELGGFVALNDEDTMSLSRQLIASETYAAFIASNIAGQDLGVLTVAECDALYLGGKLGWIQEFYIVPSARSQGIGRYLIAEAEQRGKLRGWKRLEVNTPDSELWPRTVSFYKREGLVGNSLHLKKTL